MVYAFSGEEDGYTLSRAVKEVGGGSLRLVEIDVKRDDESSPGSHDMLKCGGVYSALLRASLDGLIDGVISSPKCRTRSVLRHYPIEGVRGGGPRPLRTWEEPFGKMNLSDEERATAEDDDLMMWRSIMLYTGVNLGLEQPADPVDYKPEVVSWWRTPEWQALKNHYQFQEQTFRQSCWGGKATKSTTFGGDLLRLPQDGEQRMRVR